MSNESTSSTQDHPRAIAGIFALNGEGNVLLVKSPKWPDGEWICPGGHVEYGEPLAVAAEREMLEETGLKVKFERVFMVLESIFSPHFEKKRHFVFLECLARGEGQVKLDGRELNEYKWFVPQDALKEHLELNVRKSIEELIRQKIV